MHETTKQDGEKITKVRLYLTGIIDFSALIVSSYDLTRLFTMMQALAR